MSSLARDLVQLDGVLRDSPIDVDVFQSGATEWLRRHSDATTLAERLPRSAKEDPLLVVKLVLQALRIQRQQLEPRLVDADFVATLPGLLPMGTFGTAQVVGDMLADGAREVIALGYEISSDVFLGRLRELATRGCRIVLMYDASQTDDDQLSAGWPRGADVTLLAGRPDANDARYAKMHGKALLVNGADLLITSANLTFHGLVGNIELGIRLKGAPAREARGVLEHISRCGAFATRGLRF